MRIDIGRKWRRFLVPVLLILIACRGGCSRSNSESNKIHIYAAASLQDVLEAQRAHLPKSLRSRIRIVTAGSQVIARQVTQGAQADIVFLASTRWMDHVEQSGKLAEHTRRDLLGNQLILISSESSPPISSFDKLSSYGGRLAMGNPSSVPAGIYGKQALSSAGLWNTFRQRVVSFPHVRAVLAAVSSGEVPLGITYRTDVKRATGVHIVDRVPEQYTPDMTYPVSLTEEYGKEARKVFDYLTGKSAQAIYEKHGFIRKGGSG